MIKVAFLLDDQIIFDHSIGLISYLTNKNFYKITVILGNISASSISLNILKSFKDLVEIRYYPDFSETQFDVIFSQWGPPPVGWLRIRAKNSKNWILWKKFRNYKKKVICIPHGIEIKLIKSINLGFLSKVKSIILRLRPPFSAYKWYASYFFDTAYHRVRYYSIHKYFYSDCIGSFTFNNNFIKIIKNFHKDTKSREVFILPKIEHVGYEKFESILNEIDINHIHCLRIVLHPRELQLQKSILYRRFMKYQEYIDNDFDIMTINEKDIIHDFGTSISIIAIMMGAKLIYKPMVNAPTITTELSVEKITGLMSVQDQYELIVVEINRISKANEIYLH